MVKLFVGGFPLDTTELELVQMVSRFATVVTIKIVRDKRTGVSKGYAFIEVTEQQGAEDAIIELDGADLKGRELTLNIVVEKPAPTYRPKPTNFRPNNFNKVDRFAPADEKKKRPRRPM